MRSKLFLLFFLVFLGIFLTLLFLELLSEVRGLKNSINTFEIYGSTCPLTLNIGDEIRIIGAKREVRIELLKEKEIEILQLPGNSYYVRRGDTVYKIHIPKVKVRIEKWER